MPEGSSSQQARAVGGGRGLARRPTIAQSSRQLSMRAIQEVKSFKDGITMSGGDLGSMSQLFFDNLSTLLGALFAVQGLVGLGGVSPDVMNRVVFGKIVPGVGLTLLIGNIYYSWQAIRLTNKHGRQYTAQPYGLNTPAAFAFVFNIIYPVFFANAFLPDSSPDEAFLLGYSVALKANFITGLISIFLGAIGPVILKAVPPAALLVPIAGIGIAFLGLEQLSNSIAAPIVGYNALAWVYLGWYANVRCGWGKFRIPEALMVILVGTALGWITGLNQPEPVKQAAQIVGWIGPDWSADELFSNFGLAKDYLGIIIPIGISATATTLMCLVSAKEAGDPYPVRETLITDGIGTMIASFFGSPFGTVIYIGHPAYKRSGAKVGYSVFNGAIYLLFSWFGILALIQTIVNQATIGPIVFFVGLMINEEALNFLPPRHYAAYLIGLFPSIYDWVVNVSGRSPLQDVDGGTFYNTELPGSASWFGVLAWKRGSLLVSMVWTAMAVMIIDRRWVMASVWSIVGAALAAFGIIHVPVAGFKTFTEPTWEQCDAETQECWEHGEQWMYMTAYLMIAATTGLIQVAKVWGDTTIGEELDDPSQHAFDNWFKDAAVDTSKHSTSRSPSKREDTGEVTMTEADGTQNVEAVDGVEPTHDEEGETGTKDVDEMDAEDPYKEEEPPAEQAIVGDDDSTA